MFVTFESVYTRVCTRAKVSLNRPKQPGHPANTNTIAPLFAKKLNFNHVVTLSPALSLWRQWRVSLRYQMAARRWRHSDPAAFWGCMVTGDGHDCVEVIISGCWVMISMNCGCLTWHISACDLPPGHTTHRCDWLWHTYNETLWVQFSPKYTQTSLTPAKKEFFK